VLFLNVHVIIKMIGTVKSPLLKTKKIKEKVK